MKKISWLFLSLILLSGLMGCSGSKEEEKQETEKQTEQMGVSEKETEQESETESKTEFELALITGGEDSILDGGKYQKTWKGLVAYAEAEEISHHYYNGAAEDTASLKEQILIALENGAKQIVGVGDSMYEAVESLAGDYAEVEFCVLDGTQDTGLMPNVTVLEFDMMEAGYLAGYAAAMEGYGSVGFFSYGNMLENEYQYGFLQGLETAGKYMTNQRTKVFNVNFGAASVEATLRETLQEWFEEDGVRMVFCCPSAQAVCSEMAANAGCCLITTGDPLLLQELAAVNGVITKNYTRAMEDYLYNKYEKGHHYLGVSEGMIDFVINTANMKSFTEDMILTLAQSIESNENAMNRNTKISTADLGLEYVEFAY